MQNQPSSFLGRVALPAGVGLLTCSVLLLELLLTRLFSVALYYHFAFLAVSVALLGLGAGGLLVFLNRGSFRYDSLPGWLNMLGLLLAIAMVLALVVVLNVRMPTSIGIGVAVRLVVVFLICTIPFLFAGGMLSLLIWRFSSDIHRIYSYDLLGAAVGGLAVIPVLQFVGAPNGILLAALLAAASALLLSWATGAGRPAIWRAQIALVAIALLLVVNWSFGILDLRYAKGISTAEEVYSRWNAISRVCVHPVPGGGMDIRIDCDASTIVQTVDFWNGDRARIIEEFSRTGDDLPHILRPAARTLVIGPGGGVDVARAIAHGSPRVLAVEINPLIADDLMRGRLREHSKRLYERPEVEVVVDDARSVIQRVQEEFEIIQATGIDTWASTAAGAFALTESYLYTVEAFEAYLERLTPDGILTVSRGEVDPPRYGLRIVALGRAALERRGVVSSAGHFIVIRNPRRDVTVLAKRSPFTPEELNRVRKYFSGGLRGEVLFLPDEPTKNPFGELARAPELMSFARSYRYDVTPTTDTRPFFFFTTRWVDFFGMLVGNKEDLRNNLALFVMATLIWISLLAVLLLLWLPRRFAPERSRGAATLAHWIYFLALGIGYIVIEIALIQTFVLFMGHPTYGITVVVFSMLVGSGLGSRWSLHLVSSARATQILPLLLAIALVGANLFLFPALSGKFEFQSLSRLIRGLISIVCIMPFGFFMGMPFPLGIRASRAKEEDVLPWFWSANAAGSVLGSVLAVVAAITIGIPLAGVMGATAYLLAALAANRAESTVRTT